MRRVYVETTVVSYFTSRPSKDVILAGHQEATRKIWADLSCKYDAYISALVYEEAQKGDPDQAQRRLEAIKPFQMLDIADETRALASRIVANGGIPKEYPEDALHIASAAMNGMDVLITWNFTHMNNPFMRRKIQRIIEDEGYLCPEICSPEELLEAEI
jgi:hypothetical protein